MNIYRFDRVERRLSIFEGRRSRFCPHFIGAYVAAFRSHRARLRVVVLAGFWLSALGVLFSTYG